MSADLDWHKVASLAEIPEVGAVVAEIDGRPLAIARDSAGEIHALDDTCSHANVSLAEGEVDDDTIECWLHGSKFDLASGRPLTPPAIAPVAVHHVRVEGDDVLVALATA